MKDWKTETNERERYNLYLCSREWSEKREAVRRRAGGICERCRHNKMDAVHHLTYVRKYHEQLDDLQAICNACHEFTHGKSEYDPVNRPILYGGKVIENVYLAGKITNTQWRSGILTGCAAHSSDGDTTFGGKSFSGWPVNRKSIAVEGSDRRLNYTGPYVIRCGHGCFEMAKHSWGEGICGLVESSLDVVGMCLTAIDQSDLVFAWVDSDTCFGTINEIGYARAKGKTIFIAGPQVYRELWFTYQQADATLFEANSPYRAFQDMLVNSAGRPFKDWVIYDDGHQYVNQLDDPNYFLSHSTLVKA